MLERGHIYGGGWIKKGSGPFPSKARFSHTHLGHHCRRFQGTNGHRRSAEHLRRTIDILVNNADYLLVGAVEECRHEELKAQFETNVFGQLAVIRAVLPHMRSQKSGVIATFGYIGDWQSTLGCKLYIATKFAMVGFTESLRLEIKPRGIDVTIVEPGTFRTKLVGNIVTPAKTMDDFRSSMNTLKGKLAAVDVKQSEDPMKVAHVLVEAFMKSGHCENRRLSARLPIGGERVPFVGQVFKKHTKALGEWAPLISNTDHDDVAHS